MGTTTIRVVLLAVAAIAVLIALSGWVAIADTGGPGVAALVAATQ